MKLPTISRQNNVKGKTKKMLRHVKLKQCRLKKTKTKTKKQNMNKSATWGRGSHTLTFVLGTIFFKFQV